MKEGIIIIIITKNEVKFLRENGYGEYVHNGHGTYSRYYLTESPKILRELENYRQLIIKK